MWFFSQNIFLCICVIFRHCGDGGYWIHACEKQRSIYHTRSMPWLLRAHCNSRGQGISSHGIPIYSGISGLGPIRVNTVLQYHYSRAIRSPNWGVEIRIWRWWWFRWQYVSIMHNAIHIHARMHAYRPNHFIGINLRGFRLPVYTNQYRLLSLIVAVTLVFHGNSLARALNTCK